MIKVISVNVYPNGVTITKGKWYYGAYAVVNASSDCYKDVEWYSDNSAIASVNKTTGYIYGVNPGTTRIYARSIFDGSKIDHITVTVAPPVSVTGVSVCPTSKTMDVGCTDYLYATIYPSNATNQTVTWCSSDEDVATVGLYNGKVTAKRAGTTIITACTVDGGYSDSCEVWVHGKTPVFLIHGRTSNSQDAWGVKNLIPSGENDHFNSYVGAHSLNARKYTNIDSQNIEEIFGNPGGTEKPRNLGIELQNSGYNGNLNLFVFNYPNEDAVKYSAQKFKSYIDNIISYVRSSGSNEMKACFYASRSDYNANNYKISLIGHSMGGLISRYYIENLGQDNHVEKLITICTPHWGSGYGDLSSFVGSGIHVLCDHDLDLDSAMFGGNSSTNLNCNAVLSNCYNGSYTLTDELLYDKTRNTKYYAIAGIDYPVGLSNKNDSTFELPTNFTTMKQIVDYFTEKGIYSFSSTNMSIIEINIKGVGDNMVGFLSQIGWIGDNQNTTPAPRIHMEKIFVDVDTDGGNGGGVFVVEILPDGSNILHSKVNHRQPVCAKIIEYLEE